MKTDERDLLLARAAMLLSSFESTPRDSFFSKRARWLEDHAAWKKRREQEIQQLELWNKN